MGRGLQNLLLAVKRTNPRPLQPATQPVEKLEKFGEDTPRVISSSWWHGRWSVGVAKQLQDRVRRVGGDQAVVSCRGIKS